MNQINIPSYRDMFENIKAHIGQRKGLLMKRVLLIIWPALVYVLLLNVVFRVNLPENYTDAILLILLILLPFALLYIIALSHIFSIEKLLWIDSYGDKRKLEANQSFTIAKKLFWATFKMRIILFFGYYFLPLAIYLVLLSYVIINLFHKVYSMGILQFILTFIVFGPVVIWLYYFYLKIKLRYFWFVYLDSYEKGIKLSDVLLEMNKLNQINKLDSFKKSAVANLGADLLQNITQFAVGSLFGQLGALGSGAQVVGKVATTYSNELTSQASSLVKLAANYVLYQFSRDQVYGKSQKVNEEVYEMAK